MLPNRDRKPMLEFVWHEFLRAQGCARGELTQNGASRAEQQAIMQTAVEGSHRCSETGNMSVGAGSPGRVFGDDLRRFLTEIDVTREHGYKAVAGEGLRDEIECAKLLGLLDVVFAGVGAQ